MIRWSVLYMSILSILPIVFFKPPISFLIILFPVLSITVTGIKTSTLTVDLLVSSCGPVSFYFNVF